jgi:PAS domain S-box-containing protein
LEAERKLAEDALRESENRYRELFENMRSGVSVYETHNNGEDFIFKEYNASAEMLDNTPRGQAIGRSVVDVFPRVKDFGLFDVFQRVYRTGKPERHPVTFYKDERISGWRENHVYKLPSGEIVAVFEDITERKQMEEALRKSREQLREAHRLAHIGVWNWVAETDTVLWTEELYNIAGLDPMLPAPTYAEHPNIYAQESWDLLKEAVERAMKTGEPYQLELKLIRPDGTTRWVNAFGGAAYDNHGRIQGLYGTTQDITDRKQMEKKLHENEAKYRDLVENINDIIFSLNKEGRFTYISPVIERVLSYSPVALVGHPFSELIYPEDLPSVITAFNNVQSGILKYNEYRVFNKSGDIRWIRSSSRPNYINGNVDGIKGIAIDITEQKLADITAAGSEERYHSLFENMMEGFSYCQMIFAEGRPQDFLYLAVNKAFKQLTGLEDVVGRKVSEVIPGIRETYPELLEIYGRVALTGKPERFENYYEFLKGWLSISVYSPAKGYFVAVFDNTTEQKRAEKEVRTSHSQLRALAKRLQQIREEERTIIAREIHDEMGGGLTGLKMDLSWLSRKIDDADRGEERVALMDKIQTSNALIDHMIHVVRRISTDMRPSVLDDLGLIAALEWQLSEFTGRTEISHEFTTTCEYVNMEKDTAIAVFRIFQEALTNVVRHSRATKVAVVLREGEGSLFGDESLVLEIRDNGRGITEEEILNPESLGLLGMKERVLAFSGEISICGEPGGGTTLILKIPLIQGEPS